MPIFLRTLRFVLNVRASVAMILSSRLLWQWDSRRGSSDFILASRSPGGTKISPERVSKTCTEFPLRQCDHVLKFGLACAVEENAMDA
jgi:hypothetical protein